MTLTTTTSALLRLGVSRANALALLLSAPLATALIASASLASCSSDATSGPADKAPPSCQEDTRDEAYVAGISKTGLAGYAVALVDSLPAPPVKGNNRWTLELRDKSDTLTPDLLLEASSFMPDHGHSSTVQAKLTDEGGGTYTLDPIYLFMPGYWETTITVLDPGPTNAPDDNVKLDTMMFKFCVDG